MRMIITSAQALGAFIKDERKKQSLTQTALGKMTGVNQTTISKIEKGKPSVQLQTVFVLLAALNLSIQIGPREQSQSIEDRW
jgi:HTH-type transcriptional regulator/antitoxin HipB